MIRKKVYTGHRFGRFVVTGEAPSVRQPSGQVKRVVYATCDCGTVTTVRMTNLLYGISKSCGCAKLERQTTHGMTHSGEYNSWDSMIQRCTNEQHKNCSHYGGRGIRVCERWMSFENFIADMGQKPSPKHTIERVDNNAGYEPGNCKWATRREQQRNRRACRMFEFEGRVQCFTAWLDEKGISEGTGRGRLSLGWSIERILTTPLNEKMSTARKAASAKKVGISGLRVHF